MQGLIEPGGMIAMASSGVHPKLVQQLVRSLTIPHATGCGSRCKLRDLMTAVETLPALVPEIHELPMAPMRGQNP